jgi:hypothetical protein
VTVFDPPGAASTSGVGIDNQGTITGWFVERQQNPGAVQLPRGFVRDKAGNFTTFAVGPGTTPYSINASGTVVGLFDAQGQARGLSYGFLRDAQGDMTTFDAGPDLGPFVGLSPPLRINNQGTIAGSVVYGNVVRAFVRSRSGTLTPFDAPGSGVYPGSITEPHSINNQGTITGICWDGIRPTRGFIRDSEGNVTVFDAP